MFNKHALCKFAYLINYETRVVKVGKSKWSDDFLSAIIGRI